MKTVYSVQGRETYFFRNGMKQVENITLAFRLCDAKNWFIGEGYWKYFCSLLTNTYAATTCFENARDLIKPFIKAEGATIHEITTKKMFWLTENIDGKPCMCKYGESSEDDLVHQIRKWWTYEVQHRDFDTLTTVVDVYARMAFFVLPTGEEITPNNITVRVTAEAEMLKNRLVELESKWGKL